MFLPVFTRTSYPTTTYDATNRMYSITFAYKGRSNLDNINAGTVNDQEVNNLIDMLQEQNAMGVDNNMVNAENQPIQQQQQQKVNNQYNQISDNYFP